MRSGIKRQTKVFIKLLGSGAVLETLEILSQRSSLKDLDAVQLQERTRGPAPSGASGASGAAGRWPCKGEASEQPPAFINFTFDTISSNGAKQVADISGLVDSPITDIVFNDVIGTNYEQGIYCA